MTEVTQQQQQHVMVVVAEDINIIYDTIIVGT